MNHLRRKFDTFCFRNRSKGIPNLMLYISLGSALVYVMGLIDQSDTLYYWLCFDRALILQGQVWRLFSYALTYGYGSYSPLLVAISLLCYYSLGRAMENLWGTLRFNLFYLTGIALQDLFCMFLGGWADVSYLNMSLFLAYATLYPDSQFMLLFIIPVKAWIFAVIDLALVAFNVVQLTTLGLFPYSLYPLVALLNYFLFFGKDVINVIPLSWRVNARRLFKKKPAGQSCSSTIPFPNAAARSAAKQEAPYTHKCTVCGRTDVTNPELEFRYCSRCSGYHCYCSEHISHHTHIE